MPIATGYHILAKPFDVLDAALEDAMPRNWLEFSFERVPVSDGSVIYRLLDSEWGNIGEIKLSKISDTESQLFIENVRYPNPDMSNDNWQEVMMQTRQQISDHYNNLMGIIAYRLNENLTRGERFKRGAKPQNRRRLAAPTSQEQTAAGAARSETSSTAQLGARTRTSRVEASWTILHEYLDVLQSVCLQHNAVLAEANSNNTTDRTITRSFTVLRLNSKFEWSGRLYIVVDTSNLENPVTATRFRVGDHLKPTIEEDEHNRWQNEFVDDLRSKVSAIRKMHANIQREPTAKQTAAGAGQVETMPRKKSERMRVFGLRIEYLIAAIVLGILISIASLFVFPEWARSNILLVILFPFAFAAATNFIANFRKAYE